MALTLDSPLRSVAGTGAAKLTKAFGMATVGDLLRHYPRRYVERGVLRPLPDLVEGEYVTVVADVVSVKSRPMQNNHRRHVYKHDVVVTDGTGELLLTFFGHRMRVDDVKQGLRGMFAGKVSSFRGHRQLLNPDFQMIDDSGASTALLTGLLALYPATAGVTSWALARTVHTALEMLDTIPDPLPEQVRAQRALLPLDSALRWIHRADDWSQLERARARLRFDEAFGMQVVLAQRRVLAALEPATPRAARDGGLLSAFDAELPFTLTAGQQRVSAELFTDLASDIPMHRLLQGEVGSGKTVVALRAMLAVVDSGGQAVLLAPTEVLAQQHARSIAALLGPLGRAGQLDSAPEATRVALLTGSLSAAARRATLLDIAVGDAGIVVGTHALLEDRVQFHDLGLVVVDEQHRFGVEQRDALRSRATCPPHLLVMTATPIPRTVAMTVYGDLVTSVLDELPAGRSPISTTVVPVREKPGWLDRVWSRVREEVAAGRQVYVVCPRIGDGDDAESGLWGGELPEPEDGSPQPAAGVATVAPDLAAGPLQGLRVESLHGRMSAEDKDAVMRAFAAGDVDVLVATTVIEVGVDVANATAMVVLDADRFGISQLHQLRGRVGRGGHPGLCLLVTADDPDTPARRRLDGVAATVDGFELSRLDLEQRREGDVLGASQSGRRSTLRLLRLLRDEDVIADARTAATALVDADPALERHRPLRAVVEELTADERADYLGKA